MIIEPDMYNVWSVNSITVESYRAFMLMIQISNNILINAVVLDMYTKQL